MGGDVHLRVAPRAASRPTEIRLGDGALAGLMPHVSGMFPRAGRVLFVFDAGVVPSIERLGSWGAIIDPLGAADALKGRKATLFLPGGEASKTREVHARIEDAILKAEFTRDDAVVAIGGGAVLDVAGYAAATARRGVPWVAVPTSVVAIADASVGGKTAINHPLGKNLLGAFHPPALVIADVRTLSTLPARDFAAGLAEVYKAGVIGDSSILATLRAGVPRAGAALVDLLARAIRVKITLVEADERDEGARRALNYGHTVGHALETAMGPDAMRHGEGVAIGMGVAAEIARARGRVPEGFVVRQDADLAAFGLPSRVPRSADGARVREIVQTDKKRRPGGAHTMVLPRSDGGVDVVEDVTTSELDAALDARLASR